MDATPSVAPGVGTLYREHRSFVRNCLRRFSLREDELDDAVQDVFTVMLGRAGEQLERSRSVRPWLFGISRNLAANARRRTARRSRLIARAPGPAAPATPDEHLERREASRLLERFLDRLDPDKLAPFVLIDIEGLPAREVAERLGLSVATVRWRARVARAELERLANDESPRRLAGHLVWLWPWHSARIGPWVAWLVAAALALAWVAAPSRAPRTPEPTASTVEPAAAAAASEAPSRPDASRSATLPPNFPLAAGLASVAGRVLDPDGGAIVDALVCRSIDVTARSRVEDFEPTCTRSDALGRYHLAGVSAGLHRIGASAPGFAPADHGGPHGVGHLAIAASSRHTDVDIVLRRGGTKLEGTVVDETGGVVAGAVVRGKDFTRFGLGWIAVATTDDEGRFALWVPRGGVAVEATADGYATARTDANAPQDGVELRLVPEVVLAGRVVDRRGAPVSDVRVRANPEARNAAEQFAFTTTDSEGRFELHRLSPGRYRPTAEGSTTFGQAEAAVTLAFGEPAPELVIVTGPAASVHVSIEAPEALDGCEGDWLEGMTETHRFSTRISNARAVLQGVPPGRLAVVTTCRGRQAELVLEVGEVEAVEAALRIEAAATVMAQVAVDDEGLGAFMSIFAIPEGTEIDGPMLPEGTVSTHSDADGRLALALPRAGGFRIMGSTTTGASLPLRDFAVEDGEQLDLGLLPLPALGRIEGRVVDPDGKGMGGLYVQALHRAGVGSVTRPDGSFDLLQLVPGEYELRVGQGSLPLHEEPVDVEVIADAIARVVLSVPRLDGALSGVVVDAEGEPIPDARLAIVSLRDAAASEPVFRIVARLQADENGRFSREGLLPGRYEIEATALVGEGTSPDRPGCKGEARTEAKSAGSADVVVTCR